MAVDASGTLYFSDPSQHIVLKRSAAGAVTTVAGLAGIAGSTNGNGAAARFNGPGPVTRDAAGNLYVADLFNYVIRKITPANAVTLHAGIVTTSGSSPMDGGPTVGTFSYVTAIVADAAGNLYVADGGKIRMVTTGGVISTVAGGAAMSADGTGAAAGFSAIQALALDSLGNLFIADSNKVRRMTTAFAVSTVAGGGTALGDGVAATSAQFTSLCAIALDASNVVHVADCSENAIRKIGVGVVTTLAGPQSNSHGTVDGGASVARFRKPMGMALDVSGNMYVADQYNHIIRMVAPNGTTTTYAGLPGISGSVNGARTSASFNFPSDLAFDTAGNLYVTETGASRVRKITPAGVVSVFAGSGVPGSADGLGTAASFFFPHGIRVDASGNVFVADSLNRTIRKITPAGQVSTFAGLATVSGSADGSGASARFAYPYGLAIDGVGNLYVADMHNSQIRKISPAGVVTTLAGSGADGHADGPGAAASFSQPGSVAVDTGGNVFVADGIGLIRKVSPAGAVTTVVGAAGVSGNVLGALPGATLGIPNYVLMLPGGQLAITVEHAIVKTVGASF